jgi:hypothetical protein
MEIGAGGGGGGGREGGVKTGLGVGRVENKRETKLVLHDRTNCCWLMATDSCQLSDAFTKELKWG